MRIHKIPLRRAAASLVALFTLSSSLAATVTWSGAGANDNWSTAGNWSGGLPAENQVVFGPADAGPTGGTFGTPNNIVDFNIRIGTLSFTNLTTAGYHVTSIPQGVTLSVTNGGQTVFVGCQGINTADAQVYATIMGAGRLELTNIAGLMIIGQGSTTADSSRRATLDLASLNNFSATLSRIILGQQSVNSNRANASLVLARTNVIDLTQAGTTPGLLLGDMQSNNGQSQIVALGVTNLFLSDSGMTLGGRKGNGIMNFNPDNVQTGEGVAVFRARDGAGRQAQWILGDNSAQSGGGTYSSGLADFNTYGRVDARVGNMILGRGTSGAASGGTPSSGTLKFDAGIVDVNTLSLGMQNSAGGGGAIGVVEVNGTGHFMVNGSVVMGRYLGGTYQSHGEIKVGTIQGGKVTLLGDVICSGGAGNAITSFGDLVLGGTVGGLVNETNTPLETMDLWSGSVTLDLGSKPLPAAPLVSVTNLNVNGAVTISVRGANIAPGRFTLFKYYSGAGAVGGWPGFAGLTLSLPSNIQGHLVDNTANASVDVVLTTVSATKWAGNVNSNWDINTTANWITTPAGTSTKYMQASVPGDPVLFDDTAVNTTVTLTTDLAPAGIIVSNAAKNFTFNGTGFLSGPTGLLKRGNGTFTLSNTGSNQFSAPVIIEAGKVQLSGGNDRLPVWSEVQLSDAGTAQLDLNNLSQTIGSLTGGGAAGGNVALGSGALTINGAGQFAGVISGSGSVTKSGIGEQVFTGANTYSGDTHILGGRLTVGNETGSGTGSGKILIEGPLASLQIGNGTNAGSVAATSITNNGLVLVNRSDDLTLTTLIEGWGGFTKMGPNRVTIPVSNTYTGVTTVVSGALRISNAGALGTTDGDIYIQNDATARFELTGGLFLNEPMRFSQKQTAAGFSPGLINVSGNNTLAGPIEMASGGSYWIIESQAGNLVISGAITNSTTSNVRTLWLSGAGEGEWNTTLRDGPGSTAALRKDGAGTWKIGGTLDYTGATVVSNGTLTVNGAIARSSSVAIQGGTLAGNGLISAPVTVNATGNLAPGDNGIGKLSVQNILTLGGTTTMEVMRSGATAANDQVDVSSTLTLGGTLQVVVAGNLSGGEVFQLFKAGNLAGAFADIQVPTLPGSLSWDTSNLAVSGVLSVTGVGQPSLGFAQSGNSITFTWPGIGYKLQAQTNSSGVGLSDGWFDYPGGNVSGVSATIKPANGAVFFRLVKP